MAFTVADKSNTWLRGWIPAGLAVLIAVMLAGHRFVPNTIGNLGSLIETFLPWLGWLVLPLGGWAVWRRSALAACALVLPVLVWVSMYGSLLLDKGGGDHDLRVLTHNVAAENSDPDGTAAAMLDAEADIVALVEVTEESLPVYQDVLAGEYPHTYQDGTIGLWSRYPIVTAGPVDIELGWRRAMRAEVDTPHGDLAIYVAHLASVRVNSGFTSDQRDQTAQALGDALAAEELDRVVLLGDLNGTMQDRSLAPITYQLESTQAAAGRGFGFTWPAGFPMARIDQILIRGMEAADSDTLSRTGSDHLPIIADLRL